MAEIDQRKHERETEAYKAFLIIAKRLKVLQYDKKWEIMPDPTDPLRKFILQRDTPWFKIQVTLIGKSFYHRNDYSHTRDDWKFYIGFKGFYADKAGDITLRSRLEVKPRVVKKLIHLIDETLVPNVYLDIQKHNDEYDKGHNREKYFQKNLALLGIDGKDILADSQTDISSSLAVDPKLSIVAKDDHIVIQGSISYNRFAKIAKACGWIK